MCIQTHYIIQVFKEKHHNRALSDRFRCVNGFGNVTDSIPPSLFPWTLNTQQIHPLARSAGLKCRTIKWQDAVSNKMHDAMTHSPSKMSA